jgi:para-nitrobenzyl esterase
MPRRAVKRNSDGDAGRRAFVRDCALACASLMVPSPWTSTQPHGAPAIPKFPVFRIAAGLVRGTCTDGVLTFKGIPYCESTGGQNRFCPPRKVKPWSGVRDALQYGPRAIQPMMPGIAAAETQQDREEDRMGAGYEMSPPMREGEDCLVLNVWAPEAPCQPVRPVMVWLHGGGFGTGSGDGHWTDGSNLSRRNDVVVVSLNHRLNIFGHLYLGDLGGDKYVDSGNVGMLDVIAALEWIRENIVTFGGDPGNVTVFGQSGGGCKVNVLMAMPGAAGLFHRAIQMSGPCPRMLSRDEASLATLRVLRQLGIRRQGVDKLQEMPPAAILRAMAAVSDEANITQGDNTWRDGTWYHMFDPVVDGHRLPTHPFDPAAPDVSGNVPMLLGTTAEDSRVNAGLRPPCTFAIGTLDEPGMHANLLGLGLRPTQIDHLIREYRSHRPNASPSDVFSAIASDLEYRMDAITMAERKAALRRAPAYMYQFAWQSPAFGGKFKCTHGFDIPFVFDNLDHAQGLWMDSSPNARDYDLASTISRAWVAFARKGQPTHSGLPSWPPYTPDQRATMLLKYSCAVVEDPGKDARLAIRGLLKT